MSHTDPDNRSTGPLARVGQNDAFAGVTRIGILVVGVLLSVLGYDFHSALGRLDDAQKDIAKTMDRTTRLEDSSVNTAQAIKEFRLWAEGQVGILITNSNADAKSISALDRRVFCLESHTKCPQ